MVGIAPQAEHPKELVTKLLRVHVLFFYRYLQNIYVHVHVCIYMYLHCKI